MEVPVEEWAERNTKGLTNSLTSDLRACHQMISVNCETGRGRSRMVGDSLGDRTAKQKLEFARRDQVIPNNSILSGKLRHQRGHFAQ